MGKDVLKYHKYPTVRVSTSSAYALNLTPSLVTSLSYHFGIFHPAQSRACRGRRTPIGKEGKAKGAVQAWCLSPGDVTCEVKEGEGKQGKGRRKVKGH